MIRLGLVCSSGGAVFGTACRLLRETGYKVEMAVITDRPCGAEALCDELAIPRKRVESTSKVEFSKMAGDWLYQNQSVEWVALFFTRLVSSELYARGPCINFHPSLLPAFRGFGALEGVLQSGARFFGATAHCVDDSTDAGPILAQVVAPTPPLANLQKLGRMSFAQKLYLLLVACEWAEHGELIAMHVGRIEAPGSALATAWANPALRDRNLAKAFEQFLLAEDIAWPR